MHLKPKSIKLIYVVVVTILLVGLVPLVLTGLLLSRRSATELRSVEARYQTQLVRDKARQIEMMGQSYREMIGGFARGFQLSGDFSLLSSPNTQVELGRALEANHNLLGLYVRPVDGVPLSVFRGGIRDEKELDALSASALSKIKGMSAGIGKPFLLGAKKIPAVAIAAPVFKQKEIVAAVVGVFSLGEISHIMAEVKRGTEKELWKGGLPITFVVDQEGHALFHPDAQVIETQKLLTTIKIVREWQESGAMLQSAQIPFAAENDEVTYNMLGAYSTASLSNDLRLGVISMQNESTALASVGDMMRQTWFISLGFAVFALVVGSLFARHLTGSISAMVSAAMRIGSGDLSTRISPHKIEEFGTLGSTFNLMSGSLEENIANLARAAQENKELFIGSVKALAAAIDGKDHYTRGHSERVSRFSVAIGEKLKLSPDQLDKLRISALLHDVGKIAIDDHILKKPSALNDDEFKIMKTHSQQGYKIMSQIPGMKEFLPGIQMHHEAVDGSGYPQGLTDEQIPMQAKIIAVADTFDAMTTDRPYQKGIELDKTLSIIEGLVGKRYDPKVVAALIDSCRDGKVRPVGGGVIKLEEIVSVDPVESVAATMYSVDSA